MSLDKLLVHLSQRELAFPHSFVLFLHNSEFWCLCLQLLLRLPADLSLCLVHTVKLEEFAQDLWITTSLKQLLILLTAITELVILVTQLLNLLSVDAIFLTWVSLLFESFAVLFSSLLHFVKAVAFSPTGKSLRVLPVFSLRSFAPVDLLARSQPSLHWD